MESPRINDNLVKIRNMVSGNEKDFDLKDFINNYITNCSEGET